MLGLFIVVAVAHAAGPSAQVTDSRLTVPTDVSILRHGSLRLDNIPSVQHLANEYDIARVDGHPVWGYPYPPALFALPGVALVDAIPGVDLGRMSVSQPNRTWLIEQPVASLLTAGATVIFFRIALLLIGGTERRRRRLAMVSAIAFAFATSVWSTASRALWQHTPSVLFLTLALYLAVSSREQPDRVRWLGAVLALAYVMRPTDAIPVAAFTVWMLWCRRKYALPYFLGASGVAAVFFVINLTQYSALLPPYYEPGKLVGTHTFWTAAAGTLISPSRGLLLYSSVFLLVPLGAVLRRRAGRFDGVDVTLLAVIVLHWLLISSWVNWWGGSSFGPRLFTDVVPFLAYFLVPVFDFVARAPWHQQSSRVKVVSVATVALVAASVFINAQGAMVRATFCWNASPTFIENSPSRRLWDWSDPQFLRGFRRIADGDSIGQVVAGSCGRGGNV